MAQERELFERCSSTVVYRNLAARTSATQWQPIQQQGQQQATLASPARQDAPAMQQGQQTESATAGQQDEPPPGQQAPDERQLNGQASAAADRPKAAPSATQLQLEEADIDWEAALPESLADKLGTSAADPGDEGGSPPQRGPTTACTAAITGRTELGAGEFAPLSAAPPGGAARKTATAGPLGEGSAATDSALAAGAAADVQPAQRVSNGAAAQTAAGDDKPAAVAAPDLVRQQVELFVRAELHPLLRRGQISQGLHDAGMLGGVGGTWAACRAMLLLHSGAPGIGRDRQNCRRRFVLVLRTLPCLRAAADSAAACAPSRPPCYAVAAKSAAKVMQRHSGAGSADFLVTEAAAIRSLVQQYLKHLRQQQQQQQPT